MKRLKLIKQLFIAVFCVSVVASCGKDGPIGPQGPQGEQGMQGIRGEKGEDGTTIYSGTVAPPASLGNVGDFYYRTSNSNFYGPKTASGWGTPTSLRGATGATGARGATGAAGAPGSKILSGTAAPAASVGAVGDFYLRTSNAMLYGPKTAAGWGSPINLRGPAGPQGPPGTANVFSKTFTAQSITWRTVEEYGIYYRAANLVIPEITNDIAENGAVFVYANLAFTGQTWTALPVTYSYPHRTDYLFYGVSTGNVRVWYSNSDNTLPSTPGIRYRVVFMPGNVLSIAQNEGIDLQNYHAVKTAFGLKD